MSVHKETKRNTWYVKYQNQTKRGFKTKKEAKEYEAHLKCNKNKKTEAIQVSFYSLLDQYLDYKKTMIQYTSYLKYEEGVRLFIKELFADKLVNRINTNDCIRFRNALDKIDRATSYKNFLLNEFKEVFKFAFCNQIINDNPTLILSPFKKNQHDVEKAKRKECSFWTIDEFNSFIKMVEGDAYKALFIILFYTGMRLGEALALTYSDFSNDCISITKSYTKKTANGIYEIKIPKSQSSIRTISINRFVCDYLIEYKNKQQLLDGFCEEWFIFGNTKPLAETTIQKHFNKAITKSGVKKIRIHDLRHSHATILINNGINIVAVSRRLGHSDVNMTLKVYTHLLQKRDEEMMLLLDKSSQNLLTVGV